MLNRDASEAGFSLIELLVVVAILGVVGGITLTGLVQGMSTSARADQRIHTYTELERASERITRDLRRAVWTDISIAPTTAPPPGCTFLDLSPDAITLIVLDGSTRYRHRYQLVGGQLNLTTETWTNGAWANASTVPVIGQIVNGTSANPIFSYLAADGTDLIASDGFQEADRGRVRKFKLRLVADVSQQGPVALETLVGARNGGSPCPKP